MPIFSTKEITKAGVHYDPSINHGYTWTDFINDDGYKEMRLALQEYIYIVKEILLYPNQNLDQVDYNYYNLLYNKVYSYLIFTSGSSNDFDPAHLDTTSRSGFSLPIFRPGIPEDIESTETGTVAEAIQNFMAYFLSRQLAATSGYGTDFTVNLVANNLQLEQIFSKSDDISTKNALIRNRITGINMVDGYKVKENLNHLFIQYMNALYNGKTPVIKTIGEEDKDLEKILVLAAAFDPKVPYATIMRSVYNFVNSNEILTATDSEKWAKTKQILATVKRINGVLISQYTFNFLYALNYGTDINFSCDSVQFAVGWGNIIPNIKNIGILLIENLGVILSEYNLGDTKYKIMDKNQQALTYTGYTSNVFHFHVIRNQNLNPAQIKLDVNVNVGLGRYKEKKYTLIFDFKEKTFNDIRPLFKNPNNMDDYNTGTLYEEYDHISGADPANALIVKFYTNPTAETGNKKILIATFDRISKRLQFSRRVKVGDIPVELLSPAAVAHVTVTGDERDKNDLQIMVNSLLDKTIPLEIVLNSHDLFNTRIGSHGFNDKFELTTGNVNSLFTNDTTNTKNINNLTYLLHLAKLNASAAWVYTYDFNTPELSGQFIGKESDTIEDDSSYIIADENYKPITDNSYTYTERDTADPNDFLLEHTFAKITVVDKLIDIKIITYVSPRISHLKERMISGIEYDYNSNPLTQLSAGDKNTLLSTLDSTYTIPNYLVGSNNMLSYNPVLAVLRSMGVLEAIATSLSNRTNPNPDVIETTTRFKQLLQNAISIDETASERPEIDESLHINDVPYNVYRDFKWYTNTTEVQSYSINPLNLS